ncbi:MAG: hypothetical protein R2788_14620 [Saprospiraceae bacterium]
MKFADYQPIIGALMKVWQGGSLKPSPANLVATKSNLSSLRQMKAQPLRYRAGDDANFLLDNRKKMGEDDFVNMIKEQYGL